VHDLPLLVNIAVALAYALVGGLVARRLGLPTIVGYLVAGMALGPFTPGFHGDEKSIHQLAEFGVILLMFGVGLHFSLRDLWRVRDIAIPGALLQTLATTALTYWIGRQMGLGYAAALVLGIALSVASTVVLLRGLMDTGQLETLHGRVAVGWLVLEDLMTVGILVLLPLLAVSDPTNEADSWTTAAWAVGRAATFVILMLSVGNYLMPFVLGWVVKTRSRELFVLIALTVAAGTALVSYSVFGVSLALGAFLAGVVVGESEFSHQVGADLLPFREAFAVLFFVSVGMLVNPPFLIEHWNQVLIVSVVVIIGKFIITLASGFLFAYPARTILVVAAGLSQIGEFSFIVGQTALTLNIIDKNEYSLILAGALVSISVNPLMFKVPDLAERQLRRWPTIWRALDRHKHQLPPPTKEFSDHVVVVGCGRVGRHIAETLGRLGVPRLVLEVDPARLDKLRELNVPVLYGDAGNSEVLTHAALEHARTLVITLPDDAAALAVVETARQITKNLPIVARASTWEGARHLRKAGATEIIRPELEGGVEIVRRTLLELKLPMREVQRYSDIVRREGLDASERASAEQARVLNDLIGAAKDLEVGWIHIADDSPLAGRTLASSNLRATAGVSVIAIGRQGKLVSNPSPEEVLHVGDRVAVIGTPAEVIAAEALLEPPVQS